MRSSRSAVALAGLVACAGGTAAWVLHGKAPSRPLNLIFIGIALAGYATLVLAMRRNARAVPLWLIVGVIAGLVVEAAVLYPRNSYDLWAYSTYGRIVAHYGDNPYTVDPGSYAGDPFVDRLAPEWAATRSVYGPAFTGLSAIAMRLIESPTAAMVFFQALAGLAVLLGLLLIWRHTRDPAAIAFAGLHPVVAVSVVNGGHNDALLGLAVIGGLLLITHKRYTVGGVVLALAALVKIVGLFALAAAVWWIWRRRGRPGALRAALAGGATFVAGYAVVGFGAAFSAMSDVARYITRFSIARRFSPGVAQDTDVAATVVQVWFAIVVVVAVVLVLRYARDHDLFVTATVPLIVYVLLSAYMLPWYVAWALPVLALRRTTAPARLLAATAAALMLVYWPTSAQYPGDAWFVSAALASVGFPLLCAFGIALLFRDSRRMPHEEIALPAIESKPRAAADTIP